MVLLAILGAATGLLEFRKLFASLSMTSPFPGGRLDNIDPLTCLFGMGCTYRLVVLPLGLPSFAPSCGGLHGRTRLTQSPNKLPLPMTKLRTIVHFWVGAHSLPLQQGRIGKPRVLRHLRRCTFCTTNAVGHCVFDYPHFRAFSNSMQKSGLGI